MTTRKATSTMQTAPTAVTPTRQRNSRGHFVKGNGAVPQVTPSPRVATPPRVNAYAAGPRSLDPTPPVLALFRHDTIAILRIHDLAFSGVVSAVVQSLPGDVTTLMLVTPTDTKMFAVNAGGMHDAGKVPSTNRQEYRSVPEANGKSDGHSQDDAEDAEDPQAEAIRLAAEGDRAAQDAGLESAAESAAAEVATADTPAARRRAMNDLRRAE